MKSLSDAIEIHEMLFYFQVVQRMSLSYDVIEWASIIMLLLCLKKNNEII